MASDFGATAPGRKYLGRIQQPIRIENTLHLHHYIEVRVGEDHIHIFFLLVSDTVFSAQGSADADAQFHDVVAHSEYPLDLIGNARIEKDQIMSDIYLLLTAALFAVSSWLLIVLCDALMGTKS